MVICLYARAFCAAARVMGTLARKAVEIVSNVSEESELSPEVMNIADCTIVRRLWRRAFYINRVRMVALTSCVRLTLRYNVCRRWRFSKKPRTA